MTVGAPCSRSFASPQRERGFWSAAAWWFRPPATVDSRSLLWSVIAHGDVEGLAAVVAVVSATASVVSAAASRQSVSRSHSAFVWPAVSPGHDSDGTPILRVRLHNEGPGVAYDVRWSVGALTVNRRDKPISDDAFSVERASMVIRAVRPGESVPPNDGDWLEAAVPPLLDDDPWWPLVRWTDTVGVRWELSEQGVQSLKLDPRPLRRWRWQVWREKRDW